MRLSEKFDLLEALELAGPAGSAGPEALRALPGVVEIGAEGLAATGHRTGTAAPLPYLFEEGSGLHSPWILPEDGFAGFLGARSYMNGGGYLRGRVLIGRYASIGRRVTIGAGMHGMEGLSTSPALARRAPGAGRERPAVTVIGPDVWIGDGAVVLPGRRIGAGAVVGANAVVTRDVEPYAVVAGAPARPLRRRFDDATCAALLASRWWDLGHERLKRLPLHDVPGLLARLAEEPGEPGEPAPLPTFALLAGAAAPPS